LFTLPVSTSRLVAWPMLYGSVVVVLVYLAVAWLILAPLGVSLPLLWPCLYLVAALTQFQMIVWSLPERRYLKLLCLSCSAATITFAWMFFLPHIIEGTLSEWGYHGEPQVFLRYLFLVMALTCPTAYGVSLFRVHRERHGNLGRSDLISREWERLCRCLLFRRKTFRSPEHALFWSEWRRTGLILPIAVGAILALTCIPAALSGPLSTEATIGLFIWLLLAPFLLALVLGRGISKPDFWEPTLNIRTFDAIRPISSGQWVVTKLKVAALSTVLTWSLVVVVAGLLLLAVVNPADLAQWRLNFDLHYAARERGPMMVLTACATLLLTWKCLVSGFAAGLCGRWGWYVMANLMALVVSALLGIVIIWSIDHIRQPLHLHSHWDLFSRLPPLITAAVLVKLAVGLWVWEQVYLRDLLPIRSIRNCFLCWVVATGCLLATASVALAHIPWLRSLLMLLSVGAVPLAGPGLAILGLNRNRCQSA